jgi:hypothetical protein
MKMPNQDVNSFYLFIYLFIAVLGFEHKAITLSHSASPFICEGFCEIESFKQFAS